jgi:membrane associated rhomboid family serine protease/Zn-finger nucleic acid-binding protein
MGDVAARVDSKILKKWGGKTRSRALARFCPRCTYPLTSISKGEVELDHCNRCKGNFFDPGEIGATFGGFTDPEKWVETHVATSLGRSKLGCPAGHEHLQAFRVSFEKKEVEVDVCPDCKGLWLDATEGKQLQEILVAEQDAKQAAEVSAGGAKTYLFQLFTGFPIEVYNPVRRRPVLLLTLMTFLVFIFVGQMAVGREIVIAFCLIPQAFWAGEQLWGLLTHTFLHGGLFHLLGNIYFLYIFGDNIEDTLGKNGLVLVLVVSALVGGALHAATHPQSPIPVLGASSAVSGVIGAYLVLFPRVKVWVVFFFVRFKLGVLWYFGIWVFFNCLNAFRGVPGIAWFGHIGGFAAGVAVAYAVRKRLRFGI